MVCAAAFHIHVHLATQSRYKCNIGFIANRFNSPNTIPMQAFLISMEFAHAVLEGIECFLSHIAVIIPRLTSAVNYLISVLFPPPFHWKLNYCCSFLCFAFMLCRKQGWHISLLAFIKVIWKMLSLNYFCMEEILNSRIVNTVLLTVPPRMLVINVAYKNSFEFL